MFVVRETLPREKRGQSGLTARQRYGVLFSDRIFVGLLLVGGMNFAGLFTYLSASPFLFQDVYGFTPQQYGLLFGINSLGIVAGVQTSSRLIRRVPPQWILACSTAWMFLMAVLIVVFDQLGFGLWGVMVPLWFYILGHRLHLPARPGPGAGQPRRAGRHGRVPAGRLHVPDGRPHLPGGGLARHRVRHAHGRRPGLLHLPGSRRPVAGGPAPDRAVDPLMRRQASARGHAATRALRAGGHGHAVRGYAGA